MRAELPRPVPDRIAQLPLDTRGYPVPWFAAWLDEEDKILPRGQGRADHRVLYPDAGVEAMKEGRCWICGQRLMTRFMTFVIGPMCAVNRISAEPPSHRDCADWAARACPFLTRPYARRREAGLPGATTDAPGVMLERNPGVSLVWTTRSFKPIRVPANIPGAAPGVLFEIGDPTETRWYAEGREATHEEVLESIRTGLPPLREAAEEGGPAAVKEMRERINVALQFVPA